MASTQSAADVLREPASRRLLELEVLGRGLDHQLARGERRAPSTGSTSALGRWRDLAAPDPARRAARPRGRAPPRRDRAAACARPDCAASWAIPVPIVPAPATPMHLMAASCRTGASIPGVDAFTVVFGGALWPSS